MSVFYNDFHQPACRTLEAMVAAGLIGDGTVDGRDVATIQPRELAGFDRVHLFAGIGGFELAARLAGWPDGVRLWTGGFPCQPFSCAGQREGTADHRYLWPEFARLLRACRPEFVLVENVAAIDGVADMVLDRVLVDLAGIGYETWCAEIPACAVDAAHERNRVWIVAHCASERRREGWPEHAVFQRGHSAIACDRAQSLADRHQPGPQERGGIAGDARSERATAERGGGGAVGHAEREGSFSGTYPGLHREKKGAGTRDVPTERSGASDVGWIGCHDADALGRQRFRRLPLGLLDPSRYVVDGLPSRTLALHGLGNAVHPEIPAEIMRAMLEVTA